MYALLTCFCIALICLCSVLLCDAGAEAMLGASDNAVCCSDDSLLPSIPDLVSDKRLLVRCSCRALRLLGIRMGPAADGFRGWLTGTGGSPATLPITSPLFSTVSCGFSRCFLASNWACNPLAAEVSASAGAAGVGCNLSSGWCGCTGVLDCGDLCFWCDMDIWSKGGDCGGIKGAAGEATY